MTLKYKIYLGSDHAGFELHNDSNILSLVARFIDDEEAKEAVSIWLKTAFSGDE